MLRTTALSAALAALSAAARAGDLCSQPHNRFICYKLHPSFLLPDTPDWPSGMPKAAQALSAVGVDPYAPGGTEVYVSQRGPDESGSMADGLIIGYKSDSTGVSGTALNDYSSTAFLNFATNGYIGLGTNSPTAKLHI